MSRGASIANLFQAAMLESALRGAYMPFSSYSAGSEKDTAPVDVNKVELERLATLYDRFGKSLLVHHSGWKGWTLNAVPLSSDCQAEFADHLLLLKQQMARVTSTEHPHYKSAAELVVRIESAINVLKCLGEAKTAQSFTEALKTASPVIDLIEEDANAGRAMGSLLRSHAFFTWRASLTPVKTDYTVRSAWTYVSEKVAPADALVAMRNLNLERRKVEEKAEDDGNNVNDHSSLISRTNTVLNSYACFNKATTHSLAAIVDDLELLEFTVTKLNQVGSSLCPVPLSMIEWALKQVRAVKNSKDLTELGHRLVENPLSRDVAAIVGNNNPQLRRLIKAVMAAFIARFKEITSFDV